MAPSSSSSTPPIESESGADCLDDALADADATVAVVAPPFAGRESVLDRAADALDAPTRVQFGPDGNSAIPDRDGPLLLDDCHHCYARRIGGFDPLDRFLDRLASSSGRIVTSWNRYSWNYLDAVRDISGTFGHVFTVSPLSADELTDVLRSTTDAWPTFEFPADGDASLFTPTEYQVPIPFSSREPRSVRLPTIDVDYVAGWLRGGESPTAEELAVTRLTRLTDGNQGVATSIWDRCVDGRDTVTPDDVTLPIERGLDLADGAARVLGVLVPKERITRAELATIVPDVSLARALRSLVDYGFVTADDPIRLRPGGLPSAIDVLERRRWLW